MWRHVKVNLADLLFSFSEAMDLSDHSLVDHQMRTAYAASELARAARLDHTCCERLFVAALLHDIGALSPEEKAGLHVEEDLLPGPHCLRGAKLFREAALLAPSANIVEWHHTPYAEHEAAGRHISNPDVLSSQFLLLADRLERFVNRHNHIVHQCVLHQRERLISQIHQLADDMLHPDVVCLFNEVARREDFWLELVAKDLARELRKRSLLRSIELDFEAARAVASIFKDITDFRSRFTATHSIGVATCARELARSLCFSGKDLQQVELAGYLHDVGKLVVPNKVLLKPGPLTTHEYAVVRQHAFYTHRILSRVAGFEQIAEWAAFHHERLDGGGYSCALAGDELDLGAKIIAVADVATAIAENRPYRPACTPDTILATLQTLSAENKLEPLVIEALADRFDEIIGATRAAQADDEARYLNKYAVLET